MIDTKQVLDALQTGQFSETYVYGNVKFKMHIISSDQWEKAWEKISNKPLGTDSAEHVMKSYLSVAITHINDQKVDVETVYTLLNQAPHEVVDFLGDSYNNDLRIKYRKVMTEKDVDNFLRPEQQDSSGSSPKPQVSIE